ncbi:serine hydrolase [Sphingomonas aerolata]|uniref:Serine hydrolase n=1 Tax=Sphingomonas aerolata TaxID=185951 RepID=A0A2T4YRV5_9SPHN|nr:alpha/beta hydrolase [Sphingomonas aerolata]PTM46232.1 serine hydrolase [Sphingomonas aerolata]
MAVRDKASIDTQHAVIVVIRGDPVPDAAIPTIELDLAKFQSGRWALQLDAAFARREEPAVIPAQGVACLAVAWWAQLSPRSYLQAIEGAVLLSPLSVGFGQEAIAAAARPGPTTRLPFPSVVACAPGPFIDRVLALADRWGSHFVERGSIAAQAPTTRNATPTEDEARLIALLPLLEHRVPGDAFAPGPRPARRLRRPAAID